MNLNPGDEVVFSSGSWSNPIHHKAKFVRYTKTKIKVEIEFIPSGVTKLVMADSVRKEVKQ